MVILSLTITVAYIELVDESISVLLSILRSMIRVSIKLLYEKLTIQTVAELYKTY